MPADSRCTTIDGLIHAFYESVSGPAGPRDWSADAVLFHPGARLVRTTVDVDGRPRAQVMTPAEWVADTAPFFASTDFWEREVGRQLHRFGNIAHVLSVYEARTRRDAPEPERRGVNSIQLYWDGTRWWVINVIWDNEREGVEVPVDWYRGG